MVCGNFILPEPANYVFFYVLFNLRNLLYIIYCTLSESEDGQREYAEWKAKQQDKQENKI